MTTNCSYGSNDNFSTRIPRSDSISNLYIVPVSHGRFNKRRSIVGMNNIINNENNYLQSHNHHYHNHHNHNHNILHQQQQYYHQHRPQTRHSVAIAPGNLTRFQKQRKQMRSSFMFPNGENFTPRNKQLQQSQNHQESNLRQSFTHHHSIVSLPNNSFAPHTTSQKELIDTSYSSEELFQDAFEYIDTNDVKARDAGDISTTTSTTDTIDKIKNNNNSCNNNTVSSFSSPDNNSMISHQLEVDVLHNNTIMSSPLSSQSSDSLIGKLNATKDSKKIDKNTNNRNNKSINNENKKEMKRSNSLVKIGSIFKKFLNKSTSNLNVSQYNRLTDDKLKAHDVESMLSNKTDIESLKTQNVVLHSPIDIGKDITLRESDSTSSFLDTEVVFNNLLSEANNNSSISMEIPSVVKTGINNNTSSTVDEENAPELSTSFSSDSNSNSNSSTPSLIIDENETLPETPSEVKISPSVDVSILSDFSKLGDIISLKAPPPRSQRRPRIEDAQHAKEFYQTRSGTPGFMERLNLEFTSVIIIDKHDDVVEMPCSVSPSRNARNKDNETITKKVAFANEIYVSQTWSPSEYERCDQKFLQNKQLLNTANFLDCVKVEINEFKQSEMKVHRDSRINTQYFI